MKFCKKYGVVYKNSREVPSDCRFLKVLGNGFMETPPPRYYKSAVSRIPTYLIKRRERVV